MDCVGAEGIQEILSFLKIGYHFIIPHLILVHSLANDELGITIDLQGLYFHFLGKIESHDQCFILSFIVRGFEPIPKRAVHLMSLGAD